MHALLLIHLAATAFMTGLIWFVQIVHYPLHKRVDEAHFLTYQRQHMQRTAYVVIPAMFIELAAAVGLVGMVPPGLQRLLAVCGLILLALIWLATFLLQIPCHARLRNAFDPDAIRKLIFSNWLRTAAWTARTAIAISLVLLAFADLQNTLQQERDRQDPLSGFRSAAIQPHDAPLFVPPS